MPVHTRYQIERDFRLEAPHSRIIASAICAGSIISGISGCWKSPEFFITLLYSFLYSYTIHFSMLATQKYFFPHFHVDKNLFLWRISLLLLVAFASSISFTVVNELLSGLAGRHISDNTKMTPPEFGSLIVLVSMTMTIMITGIGSAQQFFLRLETTLASEDAAVRRAFESETKVQELELRRREAELSAEQAKQLATEAELSALKMQINPHFFFNTLNSIAALSHIAPERAGMMTEKLAEIYHYVLQSSKRPTTTLGEELTFLQTYFEIERVRFGTRIALTLDVPESLFQLIVPNLLLQPMVENAVAHAFGDMSSGCQIFVTVRESHRIESGAEIEVSDNGSGFGAIDPLSCIGKGTALKNIHERLRKMFGDGSGLVIEPNHPAGACFRIHLPLVQHRIETNTSRLDERQSTNSAASHNAYLN